MLKKNNLVILTGSLSILLLILDFLGTDRVCGGRQYTSCMQSWHAFFTVAFPLLVLFIFSLITYWMRDEIYRAWFKFARIWIPLSMLAIFLAPEYSNDWMFPIEKGTVALATSLIFVVVSLIIIAMKLVSSNRVIRE